MITRTHLLSLTGILLAACSGNDSPGVATSDIQDQYFSGGVSCGVSAVSSTNSQSTANTVDSANAVDCSADLDTNLPGPGVASTGTGSVVLDDKEVPLSSAMIDISYRNTGTDTMEVDFTLHDGNTRYLVQQSTVGNDTTNRIDWGIYDATIVVAMELTHAGSATFTGGSFNVVTPSDGEAPAEANYALEPVVFIDKRSDGLLTAEDEILEVISGNINISGSSPDWAVTLDFTLEGGATMTGTFTGSFYELPTFD